MAVRCRGCGREYDVTLFAFGRIESVVIEGDFGGRIVSYSGGINNVLARNPVPNPTPEGDWFLGVLQETGYMLPAVAFTEILPLRVWSQMLTRLPS